MRLRAVALLLALALPAALPAARPASAAEPAKAPAAVQAKAPLPKGAKPTADGAWSSPLGFRKTLDWYKKTLDKQGLVVEFLPPERFRDVTYARLLSKDPAAGFTAIHVVLAEGRTTIYIVALEK